MAIFVYGCRHEITVEMGTDRRQELPYSCPDCVLAMIRGRKPNQGLRLRALQGRL